jgi:hypothetical protein
MEQRSSVSKKERKKNNRNRRSSLFTRASVSSLPPNPTRRNASRLCAGAAPRSPCQHSRETGGEAGGEETMASAEEETSWLFCIRRTVMQMLDDRGYPVTAAEVNLSKAEFIARFNNPTSRDELMIYREKGSQPIDKVHPLSRSVPFRSSAPAQSEPLPCRSEDLRVLAQRGQARR